MELIEQDSELQSRFEGVLKHLGVTPVEEPKSSATNGAVKLSDKWTGKLENRITVTNAQGQAGRFSIYKITPTMYGVAYYNESGVKSRNSSLNNNEVLRDVVGGASIRVTFSPDGETFTIENTDLNSPFTVEGAVIVAAPVETKVTQAPRCLLRLNQSKREVLFKNK